jgi:uncharacterized protein
LRARESLVNFGAMNAPRVVACPQCGVPVTWSVAAKWRPFCSERCRQIDQGAWASDSYRVAAVDPPDEFDPDPSADDT